jgi:endoglucanase
MMLALFFKVFWLNLIVSSLQQGYDVSFPAPKAFPPLANNTKGPNLSGAEFNSGPDKRINFDYVYPPNKEIDYYVSKGFGIMRLPFDISRAYPAAYSPLNINEIVYMRLTVDHALSKGLYVILDPHNFGSIYDNRTGERRQIGIDPEGTKLFADFWGRMGAMYKNYPNVFFGLMNEPNQQTAEQWYSGAVPAIKAIREAGANQTILIPGTGWSGAHTWNSTGNAAVWTGFKDDPKNNFAFEMHQYLDIDSSGTHNTCVANASQTLEVATNWLVKNNFKGFLAEFGWSNDTNCMNEGSAFMDHLSANSNVWIGWTWWCGGPWYPSSYMFDLDPVNYTAPIVDRPQMAILLAHL